MAWTIFSPYFIPSGQVKPVTLRAQCWRTILGFFLLVCITQVNYFRALHIRRSMVNAVQMLFITLNHARRGEIEVIIPTHYSIIEPSEFHLPFSLVTFSSIGYWYCSLAKRQLRISFSANSYNLPSPL